MDTNPGRIANLFTQDDGERQELLALWREISWLTDPSMLPRTAQSTPPSRSLETNHQSIGAVALTVQEGSHLFSLYPPGLPHFAHDIAADIEYDPAVPPEVKQQVKQRALVWDMVVSARMEAAGLIENDNRVMLGFRTANRQTLSYLIAFGDALQKIEDDGRVRAFRPDHYVVRRDPCGSLIYAITKESCNVLHRLSDEQLAACKLDKATLKKGGYDGQVHNLYTLVEWQPQAKKWLVTQEVNGCEIDEPIEKKVSPYISAFTRLSEGEHYGRGFLTLRIGDLRAIEHLSQAIEDFAGLASKVLWILNEGATLRPEDLTKPTGAVAYGNLNPDGTCRDVGALKLDKFQDFTVVKDTLQSLREQMGKATGSLTDSVRNKERVTKYEVERVSSQIDDMTGGDLSAINDTLVRPQVHIYRDQCERAGLLTIPPELKKFMRVGILSGLEAIARRQRGDRLLSLAQVAALLGPEGLARIRMGPLLAAYARYQQPIDQEVVKSEEEVAAERQQQMQQAMVAQAQQTVADTAINRVGNVAEQVALREAGITGQGQ